MSENNYFFPEILLIYLLKYFVDLFVEIFSLFTHNVPLIQTLVL